MRASACECLKVFSTPSSGAGASSAGAPLRIVIDLLSRRLGFAWFVPDIGLLLAHPCGVRREGDLARGNFIDVLDRVLDKGIIIDGWGRVSVAGIDLIGIDGWVVVASIQTYLQYAESLGLSSPVPERPSMSAIPF